MIKNSYTLLLLLIIFSSCNKSDDNIAVTTNNEVKDFIWKGMNSWYNWQSNVSNLSDEKDNDSNSYNNFLNNYDSPKELFDDLLYNPGDTDRFSWFIEDFEAQQQAFQGIFTSFGIDFLLTSVNNTENIVMVFEHISENSPADIADFQRGDIINGLNGNIMTFDNYSAILNSFFNDDTVTFNFVDNDGITTLREKTISKSVVIKNPVHFTKVFDDINGKKVGYLVYNSFADAYNDELNDAFSELASANIQDFILDLRLNGGGSVQTSAYLASMIYNNGNTDDVFAKLIFNDKKNDSNGVFTFEDTLLIFDTDFNEIGSENINKISNLNRVYVLTSSSTASASEMIINGLRPYIDVVIVGDTTFGKNVGSATLYDSPNSDYTDRNTANPSHSYAMQPIIFQIFNKDNESDYTNGFEPDIEVLEWQHWNNILPFGDENEILLKTALNDIRGISAKPSAIESTSQKVNHNFLFNKFEKEMYITKEFLE